MLNMGDSKITTYIHLMYVPSPLQLTQIFSTVTNQCRKTMCAMLTNVTTVQFGVSHSEGDTKAPNFSFGCKKSLPLSAVQKSLGYAVGLLTFCLLFSLKD